MYYCGLLINSWPMFPGLGMWLPSKFGLHTLLSDFKVKFDALVHKN